MITIYGIKNCDSIKKTCQWFEAHHIQYEFHDYKKLGVEDAVLNRAMDAYGWETVINKKGTTWRQIPQDARDEMNREQAELLAHAKPSIIKRPIIVDGETLLIGFDEPQFKKVFQK